LTKGCFYIIFRFFWKFVSEIGILYDKGADDGRIDEGVDLSIGKSINSGVKYTDDADD